MLKYIPYYLLTIGLLPVSAFAEQQARDNALSQAEQRECQAASPLPIEMRSEQLIDPKLILIESQHSVVEKNRKVSLSGNVVLSTNNNQIRADEIVIDKELGIIETKGMTRFRSEGLTVDADRLTANNQDKTIELVNSQYELHPTNGRGGAGLLAIDEQGLLLTDSTFTTCTGAVPDWQIGASEINLSVEDNSGEAWHTVFRVKDIPVFYLPYFNFPLTDQRKTGFLYPKIGSSSNSGFEFGMPFYWNIAPNFDATITPNYMSKRGLQLNSEFRYLIDGQFGQLNIEYLDKDKEFFNPDASRYLHRFQHFGTLADNYRVYVDYSTISDDDYLVDIGSNQFSKTEAYLWRIGEVSYFDDFWHSTLKVQDFKVLGTNNESYKTVPQLEAQMYLPLGFYQTTFNLYGEYSRFDISNPQLPTADRFHLEAGISLPFSKPGWFIDTDARLMHTYYQQDNIDFIPQSDGLSLAESVSRTLPKIRLHAGLNFDRDTSLFFDNKIQTFEPQLQYLYIPEKEQNKIFIYDTSPLQDDFDGIFRDRRFSGLDRIAAANQLSVGATTRILNSNNSELFHLSLGRIFYLDNADIDFSDSEVNVDKSALAAELFIQLAQRWQLQSDIQYNTDQSETARSQIRVDYRHNERNLVQLSHRYLNNISGQSIEQFRLLTSFPINDKWQFVGHMTQDIVGKRSLETFAGFQYESCCWAVRFAYHRDINTNLIDDGTQQQNRGEFDSGFMVQFVLKGMGGNQRSLPIDDMLDTGIFGYKRPYFLSN
ncbi:LPS assembly protein LptD [Thalassotalea maritima]|uniref:LPS assembly protein LptD n=1 Tax=Thalassotalea maritima TaxID=3242416 RepID=UPI0035291BC1